MTLDDIPGLVTEEGIATLRRYAKDKRVLEVGVWKGKTTIAMAQPFQKDGVAVLAGEFIQG